jgi:hypothetical protein
MQEMGSAAGAAERGDDAWSARSPFGRDAPDAVPGPWSIASVISA